jgi:hypothetical protein
MIRTRFFLVTSTVIGICVTPGRARAADVYFDTVDGNDASDGSSEATAKKTIKITPNNVTHIKRGSTYSGNLNLNNAVVETYGCGPRVVVAGSLSVTNSKLEGLHATPTTGSAFNVQSGSSLRDCEADGSLGTASAMGILVMGENNEIVGNYVHDFNISQSGSTVNDSGGAEGIMVMGSNNEIAFNKVVNCESVNTTLGGYEGGCYEIVNAKGAGQTLHDVSFHHNYCEKSVGLFEACSGDYSATAGGVMQNHGIIENVTVSYNVSVDSCWLFLLQTVNTDFKNVVFANNTIVHTPKSAAYWGSSGGHYQMALAYDTDTSTGTTIKADNEYFKQNGGFQPGTVAVQNNIFIDGIGSSRNAMFMANMTDHGHNLFVPSDAVVSFALGGTSAPAFALDATESKVDLAALGLTDDYQLTAASTPAIDHGAVLSMSGNASLAGAPPATAIFGNVFNQDVAGQTVPCGALPDIGASEYCGGTSLRWPGPSDTSSCPGTGGAPSTGAASGGREATGASAAAGTDTSAGGRANAGSGAPSGGGAGKAGSLNGEGGAAGTNTGRGAASGGGAGQTAQGERPPTGDVSGGGGGAGRPTDAGGEANASHAGNTPRVASGCSCRVVNGPSPDLRALALGALGLGLTRARRRRLRAE